MYTVKLRSPFTTSSFFIGLIITSKKIHFSTENKINIRKFSANKNETYSDLLKRSYTEQNLDHVDKKSMHLKIIGCTQTNNCNVCLIWGSILWPSYISLGRRGFSSNLCISLWHFLTLWHRFWSDFSTF